MIWNKTNRVRRFNSYLLPVQHQMLEALADRQGHSKAEIVREAVHKLLFANGLDDGLVYEGDMDRRREAYLEQNKAEISNLLALDEPVPSLKDLKKQLKRMAAVRKTIDKQLGVELS